MEKEVQIDGDELVVTCSLCNGEGEVQKDIRFIEDKGKWIRTLLDEPQKCPICNGEGTIEDVPTYGMVMATFDPPAINEGYL